jgi:diguanylate cyclase
MKKSSKQSLGFITLSSGVALYRHGESAHDFVQRADCCLYAAKQGGRDRVDHETGSLAEAKPREDDALIETADAA